MLTFFRKKMKGIMIVVAVVFVASMFYGVAATRFAGGGSGSGRITGLAKVNGQEVSPYRYREIMNRLLGQFGQNLGPQELAFVQNMALGQAIDFTIILKEAKHNVRISNQEVKMAVDGIMKQEKIASESDLANALKQIGLTMSKFKEMIKNELLVQKMVTKIQGEAKVSPNDLREVKASHILVSTEAMAKEVLAKVKANGNFAALAKKYSQDPGSKDKGGDLGFFASGMMVEPFEKAAFALKVNEISDIVKSAFGYHIIKVTDSRLRKFEGKEEDVEKAAMQEKQTKAFRGWFNDLKGKAKIEIINPMLKAHDLRIKGQAFEAVKAYKKAISQEPGNAYLRVFLADTYSAVGQTKEAVAEYEAAISVDGGNPGLYMTLAAYYERSKETQKAIKEYERASMVAGENKAVREQLLKKFKELKAYSAAKKEQAEISKIEKKEAFEKELKGE